MGTGGDAPMTDEKLNDLANYFMSRPDLHGKVTLEQFIAHPDWFGYEVPISEIEEMECCF